MGEGLRRLRLAVTLAVVAGWVNAVGYLHFAHVFVSFMSGNSTTLGISLGLGDWTQALSPLLAIGSFVVGASLGSLIGAAAGERRAVAVLSFEIAVLALAFVLPSRGGDTAPALVPLAIAMGSQNAVIRRVGGMSVSLTFITGSLVRLGESIADAFLGRLEWSMASVSALMWAGLIVGGGAGAFAYAAIGFEALAVPLAVLVVVTAALPSRSARSRSPRRAR